MGREHLRIGNAEAEPLDLRRGGILNLIEEGLELIGVTAIEDKGSALFHFAVLAPAVDAAHANQEYEAGP